MAVPHGSRLIKNEDVMQKRNYVKEVQQLAQVTWSRYSSSEYAKEFFEELGNTLY